MEVLNRETEFEGRHTPGAVVFIFKNLHPAVSWGTLPRCDTIESCVSLSFLSPHSIHLVSHVFKIHAFISSSMFQLNVTFTKTITERLHTSAGWSVVCRLLLVHKVLITGPW